MLDFSWLADPTYQAWLIRGIINTIILAVGSVLASTFLSIAGTYFLYTRKAEFLRLIVDGFVAAMRNTPPLVQLFFFYFVLARFQPQVMDVKTGSLSPILGPMSSALLMLSLLNTAFNLETMRSGMEAVPPGLRDACKAIGLSRGQGFFLVIFPIALRISFPALVTNMVNIIKTSTLASAIAAPELLYYAGQIYSDNFATLEVMLLIWIIYLGLCAIFAGISNLIAKKLLRAVP